MKCTYRAAELLKENEKLKVHSVYRHTVNIVVKGRILAFHRNTIPSTPLSLALPFSEEEFDWFEREAQRTGLISIHISHEEGRLFSLIGIQPNKAVNAHETEKLPVEYSYRYCWICTGNFEKNVGAISLWEDKLDRQNNSNQLEKVNRLNELEKSGLESESQKLNSAQPENYLKREFINQENKNMAENILSVLLPVLTQNYQLGGFSDCAVTTEKRKDDSFITQILREKTAAILSKDILEDKSEHKEILKNIDISRDMPESVLQNISEDTPKCRTVSKSENISENYEANFEKQICSLIGLGPGLTPSGDDFLTGMLLAFSLQKSIGTYIKTGLRTNIRKNIAIEQDREIAITKELDKKQKQICKVVNENLERTNDISKEYLLCAIENRFGELYHELQEQLYCGNVQQDIFRKIVHTGHSSGLDTLNGLAVGLKMIKTIDSK